MKYLITTDIHEDFKALEKIINKIKKIENLQYVCLGDIIGYSIHYDHKITRDPNKFLNLLARNNFIALKGNHDLFHLKELPYHQVYKYPSNWYLKKQDRLKGIHVWLYKDEYKTILEENNKKYLKNLREYYFKNNILFSHFLFPDLTGSLTVSKKIIKAFLATHFIFMEKNDCKLSFVGHLHVKYPVIISDSGKELTLNHKDKLSLEINEKYIILCTSLTQSRTAILFEEKEHFIQLIKL